MICPLMSRVVVMHSIEGGEVSEMKWEDCQKENCQFWCTVWCTEFCRSFQIQDCALVLLATKGKKNG